EYAVWRSCNIDVFGIGKSKQNFSKDVVFSYNLNDIEARSQTLAPVNFRTVLQLKIEQRLVRTRNQRFREFIQQRRNVIVQRWNVQIARGRQPPDLLPPIQQHLLSPALNGLCEFFQIWIGRGLGTETLHLGMLPFRLP